MEDEYKVSAYIVEKLASPQQNLVKSQDGVLIYFSVQGRAPEPP